MDEVCKINNNKYKCRTCLQQSKHLLALTKPALEDNVKQMSYAELLMDITNINVEDDNLAEMPQYICGCCSRKLKSSHSFIKQAQEANEQLWVLHKNGMNNELADGLQESEIDIQACLEIKMENDEEIEVKCVGKSISETGDCQNLFKKEFPDEFSLKEGEMQLNEIKKTNVQPMITCDGFESDSSKDNLEFSISDDSEEDLPLKDLKEKQKSKEAECFTNTIKTKKSIVRKKKTLQKEYNKDKDEDIAVPCPECQKIFSNSKQLKRHLRNTHVPEDQKWSCSICGTKFTQSSNMYKHMRTLHDPESVNLLLRPKEIKDRIHQCLKCPRNYTKKKHLNYHMREKHSQENEDDKQSALEDQKLEKKTNVDIRPLCFICGGSFSNKAHLIVHMRRHTGEKPFKCDLCDKAYPRISELTVHRRIHTGEKPFKCKICEKAFRVCTKLASHMRSHTNERPYKCKQCERSFKYSKDLNIHNRIHTGERPYCCTVCGSTFTQSNSLKAHRTKLGHMEEPAEEISNGVALSAT